MLQLEALSYDRQNKIIDESLREHYRLSMERQRVPSDYLLMFTEGGESNAVAGAIAEAQLDKDRQITEKLYNVLRLIMLSTQIPRHLARQADKALAKAEGKS